MTRRRTKRSGVLLSRGGGGGGVQVRAVITSSSEEDVRKSVKSRVSKAKQRAMELAKKNRTITETSETRDDDKETNAETKMAAETLKRSLDLAAAKEKKEREEYDDEDRRKSSSSDSFSSASEDAIDVEEENASLVKTLEAKLAEREKNVKVLEARVAEMEMESKKASVALKATQKQLEEKEKEMQEAVSYTHLTLPTICSV